MANGKWTEQEVQALKEGYDASKTNESVEVLMEKLGRSKRSVIGKLVAEHVYVKPEKPQTAVREEGPTKKEILRELESKGFETEGFQGATKGALARLLEMV